MHERAPSDATQGVARCRNELTYLFRHPANKSRDDGGGLDQAADFAPVGPRADTASAIAPIRAAGCTGLCCRSSKPRPFRRAVSPGRASAVRAMIGTSLRPAWPARI